MTVSVPLLVVAIALVGGVKLVVAAAVVVPVFYAVGTKIFDFWVKYELKGRKSRGEYRVWTEDEDNPGWELHSGDVETLVALHGSGRRVAHIEESVRVRKGNPYSLGLDLTAGAFAVDVTSLIGGQGDPEYSGWAVLAHFPLLLGVILLVVLNQNASPNEVLRMRFTAALAVILGLAAMGTSFLALDAELVGEILNVGGGR